MTSEYRTYLAANVLNEDRVITYRLLSRALKVHVNTAKEMLFEFHRQQNGRKPGTVHAMYLVAGHKHPDTLNGQPGHKGESEYLQSSPFKSSPLGDLGDVMEENPLSITLVKEQDLDDLRALYETITSIHVYSLGPYPLKDLQSLSDVTREINDGYTNQDPLDVAKDYGTIINKRVRRRTGRRIPTPLYTTSALPVKGVTTLEHPGAEKASKDNAVPTSTIVAADSKSAQTVLAKDFFGKGTSKKEATNGNGNSKIGKVPQVKRETSNVFKAFAKRPIPKSATEGKDSSSTGTGIDLAAQSAGEDVPMKEPSDDEEDTYIPPPQVQKEVIDSDRMIRKEREAALKAMMEDEDDEDPAAGNEAEETVQPSPSLEEMPAPELSEQAVEVTGGRRRGKRRVMKKKTIKDEEGYLVTREEATWEYFSEDERPAKKPTTSSLSAQSSTKSKKPVGKSGQGSIMSFFGKK